MADGPGQGAGHPGGPADPRPDAAGRLWTARRLRWRMRGAWQWPSFAVLTLVDGLLMHVHPIAGDGMGIPAGVFVALFFNLAAVALVAPPVSRRLRRVRPDWPAIVADDRAGTALVVLVTCAVAVAGALHSGAVTASERALATQAAAAREYIMERAPAAYRRNVDHMNTRKASDDLYRTCVPGPRPGRALCVFVRTSVSPPAVHLDPDQTPN